MFERPYPPDTNRLSVITAAVLLALALTSLFRVEGNSSGIQLFGFYLPVGFDLRILTTLLAAGLTATGMDWFLRGHPMLAGKSTITHWILPTLTTLVVSVPLYVLPAGRLWWLAFGIGSILLVLVFLAEYSTVDSYDVLYPGATAGLISLSLVMFLILAIILRYASARLFALFPLLFSAAFLVALRALYLYLHGQWEYAWALSTAFICAQIGAALHYWPLTPVQFGLILLAPLYALISLARNTKEGLTIQRAFIEPAIILILLTGLAILLGAA